MKRARDDGLPETVRPRPATSGGGWNLYVVDGGAVRACPLLPGRVIVGRAPDCDVVVTDPAASRRHAALHVGDGVDIEDLRSANGTDLAGQRLNPRRRYPMGGAEAAVIGSTVLFVATARPPIPTPARPFGVSTAVVESPELRELYRLAAQIASVPLPVLILGETGTGKDVLAAAVHARSGRTGGCVRINCAAIAPSLMESELFGHEAGAFTGALRAKPGLLEAAAGGSVFLDEIGELPLPLQAKLLHAIESNTVLRVGAVKPRPLDTRFICATNRDLEQAVAAGEFRRDLYFRINALPLRIPPLRDRPADVIPLARHFLAEAAAQIGGGPKVLDESAAAAVVAYGWPGNARELRNVMFRAHVVSTGQAIEACHLALAAAGRGAPVSAISSERERIVMALAQCAGNQSRAATLLGLSRRHLLRKLAAYRIPRPRATATGVPQGWPDTGPGRGAEA